MEDEDRKCLVYLPEGVAAEMKSHAISQFVVRDM